MSVTNKVSIPSSCISFSEMADYLIEYNIELTQDTLINLTNILVESYNENDEDKTKPSSFKYFKELSDSIFKSRVASMKFYEKIEQKFKEEIETNKSTYKLNKKMINAIKPNQVFKSIHSFDLLSETKPVENCIKFFGEFVKVFEELKENKQALEKAVSMLNNEMYKQISGLDCSSLGDLDTHYKKYLIGDKIKIDRNWLEMNYDEVKRSVISGEILDILKNMKSSEEKIYNSALNIIKNMNNRIGDTIHVHYYNMIMSCLDIVHKCNSIILDIYHRKMIEYKGIVTSLNVRNMNESTTEETKDTRNMDNDNNDIKPQELAKSVQKNTIPEPSDNTSIPLPISEGVKEFLNKFKKK